MEQIKTLTEIKEYFDQHGQEYIELKISQLCSVDTIFASRIQALNDFSLHATLTTYADHLILKMVAFGVQEKLADVITFVEFEYPRSWWEMFKKQYAPQWFKQKFPVKMKQVVRRITCSLNANLIERAREYLEIAKQQRGSYKLFFTKSYNGEYDDLQ